MAKPTGIPISGYIEESADQPLASNNVDFFVYVLSPAGCVLYSEQHLGKNMSSTPGSFQLVLGEGTKPVNTYTATAPQDTDNFLKIFDDLSPLLTQLAVAARRA